MYLISMWNKKEQILKEGTQKPPFGAGFSQEQVEQADQLESWGSSFTETGSDFCEFRLLSKGKVIAKQRVAGY